MGVIDPECRMDTPRCSQIESSSMAEIKVLIDPSPSHSVIQRYWWWEGLLYFCYPSIQHTDKIKTEDPPNAGTAGSPNVSSPMKPSYRYGFYTSAMIGPDSGVCSDTWGMYGGGSLKVMMGLVLYLPNFRDSNLRVGLRSKQEFNLDLGVAL